MSSRLVKITASVLGLGLLSVPAIPQEAEAPRQTQHQQAMSMCGDRDDIVESLAKDFKESPMAIGQVDQSAVVEVFVSNEGTWTILATRTDGSSCIVSSGEGWESQSMVIGVDA